MSFKIGIFANDYVGKETISFLLQTYPDDVAFVVCIDQNSIVYKEIIDLNFKFENVFFYSEIYSDSSIDKLKNYDVDYFILAWWPYLIKKLLFTIPKHGILNFHPSLLPNNRGKNYNFWTIVEDCPFGVSIHFIDEGIDSGDIVFQRKLNKDWTDTGETLFLKAREEILSLFYNKYSFIREHKIQRIPQDLSKGSFHKESEMFNASKINIDKSYKARDLLNLLRARTFPPHPSVYFEDGGSKYEVSINIKKIE